MKKLFIFLILGILLVGGVSLLINKDKTTIDTEELMTYPQVYVVEGITILKDYDSTEKEISITDEVTKEIILTSQLNTPQDNKIGAGYRKVAQFTINSGQDKDNILDAFELYDKKKNDAQIVRQIDVKYLTTQQIEEDIYGKGNCITEINGTKTCDWVVVGTQFVDKKVWLDFDNSIKKDKEIIIGLFTDVQIGDKIEWIPTIIGIKIPEWAVWTQGLNVDLSYYYDFEEVTGDFENGNLLVDNNLSVTGTINRTAGKIGNGTEMNGSTLAFLESVNDIGIVGAQPRTTCFWAELDDAMADDSSQDNFVSWGVFSAYDMWVTDYYDDPGSYLQISTHTGSFKTNVETDNNMNHHCVLFNGTQVNWMVNGVSIANVTTAGTTTLDSHLWVGSQLGGSVGFDGIIDELGIWNRTLTGDEVVYMYNGGAGMPYVPEALVLIPISPENNVNLTTGTIDFLVNVSDLNVVGIQNVTLKVIYPNGTSFYNETNVSGIEGIYNFSTVSIPIGNWNWSVSAYGDDNNSYESDERIFLVYQLLLMTENYDATITEGLSSIFSVNFLTNGSDITEAILLYNATTNTGIINNHGGNNFTVMKTITAPSVNTDTNQSFYWNITQGIVSQIFAAKNQTVLNLEIDNCTANSEVLYNFTIADEANQLELSGAGNNTDARIDMNIRGFGTSTLIEQFNASYSQINPFGICFNSTGQFNIDVQIQYNADGYEIEFYHIQNASVDATDFPTNITLFSLNSSDSQLFKLVVKDSSFLAIKDALVEVHRKYVEEGVFKIVEIPRTDGKGETAAHLVIQDAIYKFIIKKFGVTIATFENVVAVCQTPLVTPCTIDFNAFAETVTVPDFEEAEDFLFTLGFNSTSRIISSVFSVPSGTPSVVAIEVIKEDALGTSICTDTLTSSSGTLNCDVGTNFGNSTVLAKIYRDGDLQAQGQVKLDQDPSDIYGGVLVFLALLIMMTLIGAGISDNPVYTVLFLMVGVILLFGLNLVASNGFIGATATILWLIVAIILVLIKGGRRN